MNKQRQKNKKHSKSSKTKKDDHALNQKSQGYAPDWWVAGPAFLGILITLYLTGVAWSESEIAFCTSGSGCSIIQQSRWSTLLGTPIALWGLAVYTLIALSALTMKPRMRRWKRLWYLALTGVAVSIYLTAVGIVALDAVCIWCLASLIAITGIFAAIVWRRPSSAPGMSWQSWLTRSGIVVAVIIGLMHGYYSGLFQPAEDPRLKALAIHLKDSGAKFYGAYWCPECNKQKEYFGASADRLPYIECTPDGRDGTLAFACVLKDINGYPTWIINGQRHRGVLAPQRLAQYSGFQWDKKYSTDN